MRVVQLDPAIASITGSPMPSHEAKVHQQPEQRAGHVVYNGAFSDSTRSAGRTHLINNNSATSSPISDDIRDIPEAQDWRDPGQGKFVRQSGSGTDDPFVSNGTADPSAGQGKAHERSRD